MIRKLTPRGTCDTSIVIMLVNIFSVKVQTSGYRFLRVQRLDLGPEEMCDESEIASRLVENRNQVVRDHIAIRSWAAFLSVP